jgi:hypothetical protein
MRWTQIIALSKAFSVSRIYIKMISQTVYSGSYVACHLKELETSYFWSFGKKNVTFLRRTFSSDKLFHI